MEAPVPAFLAAVLTQLGDRPAWLTAILGDRYGRPLIVALAAGLGHGLGNAIAAIGGGWVAPLLTPAAQTMMLAIALALGAIGMLVPPRAPGRMEAWRAGPLLTPFAGVFALAIGDKTQFITFALAARGMPILAAVGASLGAFAIAFVAATLGERTWRGLPFRAIRITIALAIAAGAAMLGLAAAGLL